MRNLRLSAIICLGVWGASAALASPNEGTVKICRWPQETARGDNKPLTIPAGSTFVQQLADIDHVGSQIKLTENATLPPKPGCATAEAVVTESQPSAPAIKPGTKFLSQINTSATLITTAVSGF